MPVRVLLPLAAAVGLVAPAAAADPAVSALVGQRVWVGDGKDGFGVAGVCVVARDNRPAACFVLDKRPGEPCRYPFLILLPPDAPADGLKFAFAGRMSNDKADVSGTLTVDGKEVAAAYKATFDKTTHRRKTVSITLAGKEIAADGPRLFLADLSGEKVLLTPVKVDLPAAPDVGGDGDDDLGRAVLKTVDRLKGSSPAVKAFLDRPAEP